MHTVKKYAFYVQLLGFALFVKSSHENTAKTPAIFACKVNLSDNFVVEWSVNETAKSVEFKVNVTIDEKGWVLLGFMPIPKNKSSDKNYQMKLSDTRGDFLITWPSSSSERTSLDLNTINKPGVLVEDNNTHIDYHVSEVVASTNTSLRSVLLISRKLDTGDPQDVPITDEPMWIFGAYGNSNDYFKDLSAITSNINDNLAMKEVIIVQKSNKKEDSIKPWHKVLKEQMEKHWIGVALAVSGVLTIVITGTVYCCFRKSRSEFKSKKLKMTFYREDEDDEARVAFLHSRT